MEMDLLQRLQKMWSIRRYFKIYIAISFEISYLFTLLIESEMKDLLCRRMFSTKFVGILQQEKNFITDIITIKREL
ncbi:hypothetical protein RIF29_26818 [Crotalaria pallida]|uniref:Uncharacterized protein n=1 Tax=Crotalaria pallida TaxID=3830 RepID=A0AAN9ENQ0_CROPI